MIAELQIEKQRLDEAIEALERLASANHRRRGRPVRWSKDEQISIAASSPGVDGSGIHHEGSVEDIEASVIES